jgi:glutaredoxin 3
MSKVTIYSTPTCHYCKDVKEFFKENNVAYEEFDVASNMEKRKEMVDKSGQLGVPVTDIDGSIIVGFDREALTTALKI